MKTLKKYRNKRKTKTLYKKKNITGGKRIKYGSSKP
jgi:hypothetical protein